MIEKQMQERATAKRDLDEKVRFSHSTRQIGSREVAQIRLLAKDIADEEDRLASDEQSNLLGNVLRIAVAADADGEITLELKYAVSGTSWRPSYVLRVSTETSKVKLGYKAIIQQETGEVRRLAPAMTSCDANIGLEQHCSHARDLSADTRPRAAGSLPSATQLLQAARPDLCRLLLTCASRCIDGSNVLGGLRWRACSATPACSDGENEGCGRACRGLGTVDGRFDLFHCAWPPFYTVVLILCAASVIRDASVQTRWYRAQRHHCRARPRRHPLARRRAETKHSLPSTGEPCSPPLRSR